jgi:hypothetical protein
LHYPGRKADHTGTGGKTQLLDFAHVLLSGQSGTDWSSSMTRLWNMRVDGTETVLDLYCGVGTIGLYCASQAKK